ncbi:MAG: hypothetical protein WC543_06290 [Candidatus Omnitrophota bacterium]
MVKTFFILLVGFFLVGCTTPTGYHKSVTIEKDGDNKIVKTTIVEEINQPYLQQEPKTGKYLDQ